MNKLLCALAVACAGAVVGPESGGQLNAAEIGGRYVTGGMTTPASAADGASNGHSSAVAGIVEISPHRNNAYSLVYEPAAGSRRKRRGSGLLAGEALAVGVSTGGSAYGAGIYERNPSDHSWSGPWMTNLDGGATLGTIRFTDDKAASTLEGRHELTCTRPGAGRVTGSVDIKPATDGSGGYRLAFRLGLAVYYRGAGLLLPDGRLAVGWSFGSAPEVAVYQVAADGSLTEHRCAWTAPTPLPPVPPPGSAVPVAVMSGTGMRWVPAKGDEYVAATGGPGMPTVNQPRGVSSAMPLFTSAADFAAESSLPPIDPAAAALLGPTAPQVKAWSYGALMRQYGNAGWAERWIRQQLTPEELQLLGSAVKRHSPHGKLDPELESRSIGTLIAEEKSARQHG